MSNRIYRGIGVSLAIGALWLSAVVAPAAAATGTTRWVAANPGSGKGPAKCATAPYSSIQDAIDNANNWDTVMVCPGTYTEQLYINVRGLTVKSTGKHTAKLVAPAAMDSFDGEVAVVIMDAYAVRLIGFDIGIPSGDYLGPASQPADGVCTHADGAVWARDGRARVNRNNIHPIGPNSLSGECGYDYGIVFAAPAESVAPTSGTILTGSDVSRAAHNKITDFRWGGIMALGPDARVHIDHNRLAFLHTNDPSCSVPFGATASVSPQACTFTIAPTSITSLAKGLSKSTTSNISPAQVPAESFGILAADGAAADIDYNNIHSGLVFVGTGNSVLGAGIWMEYADGSSRVFRNSVTNAGFGLITGEDLPGVSSSVTPSVATDGVYIVKNQFLNNLIGVFIEDDANHLVRNVATANFYGGIYVYGQGNLIENNNFAYNFEQDCYDGTSGDAATVSNTWTSNLGVTSAPVGICVDPSAP